ncbi:MAG: WecB/TagA/CpsF family glycosyltransferase [Lachnospiraceae bacterium]|nr:WecB/TagA/CpsF family glycosyltransferase [Lachnospiraceae bacterium]
MQDRVRLLGLFVDIASTNDAGEASIRYLEEECSKSIYFVNSETLILLQASDDQEEVLESCSMILPGTASVSAGIDEVLGNKRDPFFLESYFDMLFGYAVENGSEVFLVAGSESQYNSVQENIHEKWSYLTLSGTYLSDQDSSYEHIVNEINSIAPDILILALNENIQIELLKGYRELMNASLILYTGNVLYNKAVSEAEVPESIEKLGFGNIYKWFHKDSSGKNLFNNIKMKFRIKRDK